MGYEHTQRGGLHYILLVSAAGMIVLAWATQAEPIAFWTLSIAAFVLCVFSLAFQTLTVRDDVDCLVVSFGPLPLFRRRIRYDDMTSVERARSSLLDGWGIHYVFGRGWIYNLWGFDCARITLGNRVLRVGTDDVDRLVQFLDQRISQGRAQAET